MIHRRDFQRSEVYKTENKVKSGSQKMTLEEAQEFVDKITKSIWYKNRFKRWSKIKIKDGHKHAYGYPIKGEIHVPKWARCKLFVLHEVTHVIAPMNIADHGKEFCALYIKLVERWLGRDAATELRQRFKEGGVKW